MNLNKPNDALLSAFLITYLGKLPAYFDFWAKSCESNHKNFHWFVYTDQITEVYVKNKAVTLVPITFDKICQDMQNVFGISIPIQNTRIVCDIRLMLYPLRKSYENLEKYDFIGYTDIDVMYGKIIDFLPENIAKYSMISAHTDRPCGPFTLFNKKYLHDICSHKTIRSFFEQEFEEKIYKSKTYSENSTTFKPMSGNSIKDKIAKEMGFSHLDEAKIVVSIAQKFAPVFCNAEPLQPAMTNGFHYRKAFAIWNEGRLYVNDVFGVKKEGAFFHFSRFKNRSRFKSNPYVLGGGKIGICKYGFISIKSRWTKLKLFLSLLY